MAKHARFRTSNNPIYALIKVYFAVAACQLPELGTGLLTKKLNGWCVLLAGGGAIDIQQQDRAVRLTFWRYKSITKLHVIARRCCFCH